MIRSVDDGTNVTDTVYVAGMEIELLDGTKSQRTINYPVGDVFRIIGGSDEGLYFTHTDHLGSTSVISDTNGDKVTGSDVVHAPFGESRVGTLSDLTDQGFTGQRLDRSADGVMYYNARYYLPELRRFISADTVVPNPGNPQDMNRYAYSRNNPGKYTDPTGHEPEMWSDEWWVARYYALELWQYEDPGVNETTNAIANAIISGNETNLNEQLAVFGVQFTPSTGMTANAVIQAKGTVLSAVLAIANKVKKVIGGDSLEEAFTDVFGENSHITVYDDRETLKNNCGGPEFTGDACNRGSLYRGADIRILATALVPKFEDVNGGTILVHEFGHTFTGPLINDKPQFNSWPVVFDFSTHDGGSNSFAGEFPFRVNVSNSSSEVTADSFLHWVLGDMDPNLTKTLDNHWIYAIAVAAWFNSDNTADF